MSKEAAVNRLKQILMQDRLATREADRAEYQREQQTAEAAKSQGYAFG